MFSSIALDKRYHFVGGFCIFLYMDLILTSGLGTQPMSGFNVYVSLLTVVVIAIAKEALDWVLNWLAVRSGKPPRHGVERADFMATCAGGLVGFFVANAGGVFISYIHSSLGV